MCFRYLYVRVGTLLACRMHVHDYIISLRGEVWTGKDKFIAATFFYRDVCYKPRKWSVIVFVLRVSIFPLSVIILLDFGIVLTVWYFVVIHILANRFEIMSRTQKPSNKMHYLYHNIVPCIHGHNYRRTPYQNENTFHVDKGLKYKLFK